MNERRAAFNRTDPMKHGDACSQLPMRVQVLDGASAKGLTAAGDRDWLGGVSTFLAGAAAVQATRLDPLQAPGLLPCMQASPHALCWTSQAPRLLS